MQLYSKPGETYFPPKQCLVFSSASGKPGGT